MCLVYIKNFWAKTSLCSIRPMSAPLINNLQIKILIFLLQSCSDVSWVKTPLEEVVRYLLVFVLCVRKYIVHLSACGRVKPIPKGVLDGPN